MAHKIWRNPPLSLHGGHIAIRSCHMALKMLVLHNAIRSLHGGHTAIRFPIYK